MRDKLIDGLLLVTMIAVAILIVVTLFSPSSLRFGTNQDANSGGNSSGTSQQDASNANRDIIPISPDGANADSGNPLENSETVIVPILPDETLTPTNRENADSAQEAVSEEAVNEAEGTLAEESPVDEAEPEEVVPVSEGNLVLERIGFSFVTGGAGACSIVLEPWRHVAVSRDILATYPCGTELSITLAEPIGGRQSFRAIVADTMNPVHEKTVNIYVGQEEPALSYGVREGRLEP